MQIVLFLKTKKILLLEEQKNHLGHKLFRSIIKVHETDAKKLIFIPANTFLCKSNSYLNQIVTNILSKFQIFDKFDTKIYIKKLFKNLWLQKEVSNGK